MQNQALRLTSVNPEHSQLNSRFEASQGIQWWYMNASPRPCFTPQLLGEIQDEQRRIMRERVKVGAEEIEYIVLASQIPGVFNLGGDLGLFRRLIDAGNSEALRRYARTCVDLVYQQAINLDLPLTTIALVQGDALGGGFEAALANSVIIAEKQAQLGLPEILFNLFPGMGAFSFLARRLDPVRAERIIMSGKLYTAEELYEMGVIDVVVDEGDGVEAVYEYIAKTKKSRNTQLAMQRVKQQYNPLRYDELVSITDIWVDAALNLNKRDLKLMERLVRAQNRRRGETSGVAGVTPIKQPAAL